MRTVINTLAAVVWCLCVYTAFAASPARQYLHFTVYINAVNGEVDHYVADEKPMSGETCLKKLEGMGGRQVKNGLAEVHLCRAVDAKGAPVPEIKVNPETMQPLKPDEQAPEEDAPKVTT